MKIHELKIFPEYMTPIIDGGKTFEVRRNDRGFQVGDILHLRECTIEDGIVCYTGRELKVRVSYVLDDPNYCKEGFAILGFNEWLGIRVGNTRAGLLRGGDCNNTDCNRPV